MRTAKGGFARLRTERAHPGARELDTLTPRAILELMAREDDRVVRAVYGEARALEAGAALVVRSLERGGRVFYLGAGTSGRLGVLEAAECPPTFGTRPSQIQALVAGGRRAVFRAVEGAEDSGGAAERVLRARKLTARDLVVGVSASSVTPFVRGGLAYAKKACAATMLVTCGRPGRASYDQVVSIAVGPEIIAGSTRLKAGTATKLALNALTVLAMIRLGKVYGPFMVDVRPGSAKLRDRARRMVAAVGRVSAARARSLLDETRGDVKVAIVCARLGVGPNAARRTLARSNGRLRSVLAEP